MKKERRLFRENWFCQEDHTVPKLHCLVRVEQSLKTYVPQLRVFVVHVQILIFLIIQTNKQTGKTIKAINHTDSLLPLSSYEITKVTTIMAYK